MSHDQSARTIDDLQASLEAALERAAKADPVAFASIAPPGCRLSVSLRRATTNRQIKRTADASNWDPAIGIIVLACTRDEPVLDASRNTEARPRGNVESPDNADEELEDLVLALDAAQHDARYREFVGLKHFRDEYLPKKGFRWSEPQAARDVALRTAIERGMILKGSVPNPRMPEFVTTSIRVNSEHPGVQSILQAHVTERSPFQPMPIRGEDLSHTVIKDRR